MPPMKRGGKGGRSAYHRSAEFRAIANAALARWNARRASLPKCGAARRSDGGPCQNLPLANGRCRLHGGKTPSGDGWHRPVWPDKSSPKAAARLNAKLRALQEAERERKARWARMTPEERERYEEWHRLRPVGTPGARQAERQRRKEAEEARRVFSSVSAASETVDPAYAELVERIEYLKEELEKRRASTSDESERQMTAEGERKAFG
ncbi:MAG: hypothetical protein EP320_04360 [Rhodobacteraceae bacterium]|nr:MAG: hypothetical protein EP320_04360 [Paracoccaceae bacterium]